MHGASVADIYCMHSGLLRALLLVACATQADAEACTYSGGLPCDFGGCIFSKDGAGALSRAGTCASTSGSLSLNYRGIRSLSVGVFDGLLALQEVWLADNALTSLPAGVFDGLAGATELRLNRNALTSLPAGVFDGLSALQKLHLDSNALTSLPAGVFDGLAALKTLYLQSNALTSLPAGVFDGLTALETLVLSEKAELSCVPVLAALRSRLTSYSGPEDTCANCTSPNATNAVCFLVGPSRCDCPCNVRIVGGQCTECMMGKYKTALANTVCTSCGAGKYSAAIGAMNTSTCLECPANSDSLAGSSAATACTCNAGWTGLDGGGGACEKVADKFIPRMPPISRFMGKECLKAAGGLSQEIETPWFLKKGASFNQTSFIVTFALYGCLVIVTFGLQIMVRFVDFEFDEQERETCLKLIRWGSTFVIFSLWFFYDFVFMCARLNWLFTSADADFEPWGFSDRKHDGDVLWVNRRFFTANSTQLEEAGCEFEDKFTHDYRSIWSATEKNYGSSGGSYPTPLGGHACELVVKFSAEILATCDTVASDFEMGAEATSMVLGLIIYPVLMFVSIGVSLAKDMWIEADEEGEGGEKKGKCVIVLTLIFVWMLEVLLACQQAVVLLPVISMTYTPFCAIMNVPSNRKYGACIHKWASAGLPYGIPMMILGGGGVAVAYFYFKKVQWKKAEIGSDRSGRCLGIRVKEEDRGGFFTDDHFWKNSADTCCGLTGLAAGSTAFFGALLFLIWLFGGLTIGIWFEASEWAIFGDLGVFKMILAPSAPICIRLLEFLSMFKITGKSRRVMEGTSGQSTTENIGMGSNYDTGTGDSDIEMTNTSLEENNQPPYALLPHGWASAVDHDTRRRYYINRFEHSTSWNHPGSSGGAGYDNDDYMLPGMSTAEDLGNSHGGGVYRY